MRWLDWLLGRPPEAAKDLGRNAPCWCGSGKKYKRCHLASDEKHVAKANVSRCTPYG